MKRVLTSRKVEKVKRPRRTTEGNPLSFPSFLSFITRKPRARKLRRSIRWLHHCHYYFIKRMQKIRPALYFARSLCPLFRFIRMKTQHFFVYACASSIYKILKIFFSLIFKKSELNLRRPTIILIQFHEFTPRARRESSHSPFYLRPRNDKHCHHYCFLRRPLKKKEMKKARLIIGYSITISPNFDINDLLALH